jgi:Glutaminase
VPSGDWLYKWGLPGKRGISGGIVTVSAGKPTLALPSLTLTPVHSRGSGNDVALPYRKRGYSSGTCFGVRGSGSGHSFWSSQRVNDAAGRQLMWPNNKDR